MTRKLLTTAALAGALGLAGCNTTSTGGVVSPGTVIGGVTIPGNISTIIQEVVAGTEKACSFQPIAATVIGIVNTFQPGADVVGVAINDICAAAEKLKTPRAMRSGKPMTVTVRGVAIQGRFLPTR